VDVAAVAAGFDVQQQLPACLEDSPQLLLPRAVLVMLVQVLLLLLIVLVIPSFLRDSPP
jgi:hypothetical protein